MMSKRTTFTSITPLPSSMSRETAIAFLHNHVEMIDLNPLVIERHPIPSPPHAEPEEETCSWYSITDRIYYVPGIANGEVPYTCAFHNMPWGLQTHCHAPMGLDIRDKWSVGGSLPGEPPQPQELGIGAPMTGLYLREDVDFKCNILMAGFVKKTLKKSHGQLVEKMAAKADIYGASLAATTTTSSSFELEGSGGEGGGNRVKQQQQGGSGLGHSDTFISTGARQQSQIRKPVGSEKALDVPALHEAPSREHMSTELPGSEPPLRNYYHREPSAQAS